jgi:tripartite-type tricarboxylate transporter receptor subunit TctC
MRTLVPRAPALPAPGAVPATFAVLLSLMAGSACAQAWPAKAIRIVVSATPGGGVDTSSRIVGQGMTERWGQAVLIENRPGGGGAVAGDIVARSAPDGYTLKTISIGHSVLPSTHRNLSYDPERDLVPVSVMVNGPNVLVVHPSLPVKSVKELVSLARSKPGELLYASSGNAGPPHMAMELFRMLAGIDLVHVPYKGTGPGMADLVAGRVSMTFASVWIRDGCGCSPPRVRNARPASRTSRRWPRPAWPAMRWMSGMRCSRPRRHRGTSCRH